MKRISHRPGHSELKKNNNKKEKDKLVTCNHMSQELFHIPRFTGVPSTMAFAL